jgi:hypothetical protein
MTEGLDARIRRTSGESTVWAEAPDVTLTPIRREPGHSLEGGILRMAYIRTVPENEATGELRALYDEDIKSQQYVANYTQAMSLRPKAIAAWRLLSRSIRANMKLRRYELVTLAAAIALRCTY